MIPAVLRDSRIDRVAQNQTVYIHQAPAAAAETVTPGVDPPATGSQVIGSNSVTISNFRAVPILWSGEEVKGVNNNGPGFDQILADQVAQAIRTLCNEIETDLCELYSYASRAYGTAGTAPFGTAEDLSNLSQTKRILIDNGAPREGLQCVLGSAAMANFEGKQRLWKVNETGSAEFMRNGFYGSSGFMGFAIRETGQVQTHTKGTATGYDANGGEPVGETTIVVDGSDSGTILAGDVVTFSGDTNKYVVRSTTASGAASGNIVINKPGLEVTLADTVEGTTGNSYTANLCFHRNAIVLASRLIELPPGGDSADGREIIIDPISGLAFEFATYPMYYQRRYEVSLAWGVAAPKPEHIAIMLG